MYEDPIAYFLTWTTYGAWLPGDSRGWVKYHSGWQLPDTIRELEAKSRMTDDACILSPEQRQVVETQISETCAHRGWTLHAVNCRSNHIHVVVSGDVNDPEKIRIDLKAWSTRALKRHSDSTRNNWWAERGSIRYVNREDDLEAAILYVLDDQGPQRYQPDA